MVFLSTASVPIILVNCMDMKLTVRGYLFILFLKRGKINDDVHLYYN